MFKGFYIALFHSSARVFVKTDIASSYQRCASAQASPCHPDPERIQIGLYTCCRWCCCWCCYDVFDVLLWRLYCLDF